MGDLIFLIRMVVYTLILVVILQVKVGTSTLEERVIDLTHRSQIGTTLQEVAQGAARFIGQQYNKMTGHLNSKYIKQHSKEQIPGQRLKAKVNEFKESIRSQWKEQKQEVEEFIEEDMEQPQQ